MSLLGDNSPIIQLPALPRFLEPVSRDLTSRVQVLLLSKDHECGLSHSTILGLSLRQTHQCSFNSCYIGSAVRLQASGRGDIALESTALLYRNVFRPKILVIIIYTCVKYHSKRSESKHLRGSSCSSRPWSAFHFMPVHQGLLLVGGPITHALLS